MLSLLFVPSTPTKDAVMVQLTLDEPILPPEGWLPLTSTQWVRTFTENTGILVEWQDSVGNRAFTGLVIDRIDTTPPSATVSYATTGVMNDEVLVSLTTTEPILQPLGRA
ncbi:MAG: hypothetical protein LBU27_05810 [Candidatus Peribacteria bacterium]|nr:hypothetical protein [Candidatus Peribacteria bacterium]